MRIREAPVCSIALVVGLAVTTAAEAQWPQFGGPGRDFSCKEVELKTEWPAEGPRVVWSRPLGEGYSGIAIEDGRLFTMYRDGGDEVVIAADPETGKTLWEHRYAEPIDTQRFAGRYGYGPRSTPLVVGGRVSAIGFNGRMTCLDAVTGREIWSIKLLEKFIATPTRWGYANSPIAHGGNVIVPVGGIGAAFVALDQASGAVRWKRHDFENSYGSPVRIEVDGKEQFVCLMAREIVGFNPENGDLLWRHPHEGQWLNNVPNPVWGDDGLLFVTSEGDAGSRVLRLKGGGREARVSEVWASRKFRVVHRNIIRVGDHVYGSSGDFGATLFSAVDVRTGEVSWRRRDIGRAGMLRLGRRLLILEESGRLILASPSPSGLEIHASSELLKEPAWTIPSVVGRRLFLRDHERMMAVDLP